MIEWFVTQLDLVTTCVFMLGVLGVFVFSRIRGQAVSLEKLVSDGLAITMFPTGLALLICAIDTTLMSKLGAMRLNIAVAGIVVTYISLKAARDAGRFEEKS